MAATALTPILCPFTVVVDTREQMPFTFRGIKADADQQNRPVVIRTVRRGLATGDYSIEGYESAVCVERKNLADLFGSLGQGRERFQREHERMAAIVADGGYAAVVVEGDWDDILEGRDIRSRLPPKVAYRTALAWAQRYRVHWWAMGARANEDARAMAERTCFRILERFYLDRKESENVNRI